MGREKHMNRTDEILLPMYLQARDKQYDPKERTTTRYRGVNGYHSRLKDRIVHDIRDSFVYARELLLLGGEEDLQRVYDILYRVIPLQDINPSRKTYGIWPYYVEESLEQMDCPDWNWADFIAKEMLVMLIGKRAALPLELQGRMQDAIWHACQAIIKRNVGPGYTNISVMGAYVTIVAGELFGWTNTLEYGKKRLERLYEYNKSKGNFSEFNSPTYTFVALIDLNDLKLHSKDDACRAMAEELCDMAWETIACHYHPGTGQLAGPHYRAYRMLLSKGKKLDIERALDFKVKLSDREAGFDVENIVGEEYGYHEALHCPEKYKSYFTGELSGQPRILENAFEPPKAAYTFLHSKYTIGSINKDEAWNQHRNVLGFLGTVDAPIGFNLKCLHDNWDYCSGLMSTVQDRGRVLSVMNFSTNSGDTHVNLDMVKDASILAKELIVTWQFEGEVEYLDIEKRRDGHSFLVKEKQTGISLLIDFAYVVFDKNPVEILLEREEGLCRISAVLYRGDEKKLDFSKMKEAAVVTSLQVLTEGEGADCCLAENGQEAENGKNAEDGSRIEDGAGNKSEKRILPTLCKREAEKIEAELGNLKITAPLAPGKEKEVFSKVGLFRNGQSVWKETL